MLNTKFSNWIFFWFQKKLSLQRFLIVSIFFLVLSCSFYAIKLIVEIVNEWIKMTHVRMCVCVCGWCNEFGDDWQRMNYINRKKEKLKHE